MDRKRTYGYDFDLNVRKLFRKENTVFDYLSRYQTLYLDSGRNCIRVLCSLFQDKKILVPAFSCKAVIHAFDYGVQPVFYHVRDDFVLDMEDLDRKLKATQGNAAAIYVTNYYGRRQPAEVAEHLKELRKQYGLLLIEDNTQSFFSGGILVGDYAFASIRKWFPVPDGGVIYAREPLDDRLWGGLRQDSKQMDKIYPQALKSMILKDMIDYPTDKVADMFADVEEELDEYTEAGEVFLMTDFTHFVFECNAVPDAVSARLANEKHLRECIDNPYVRFAFAGFADGEVPFQLPMYSPYRDEIFSYLTQKHNIYPSVLWRTHLYDEVNTIGDTARMGREIFSLPVDQRYDLHDMEILADALNAFRPAPT